MRNSPFLVNTGTIRPFWTVIPFQPVEMSAIELYSSLPRFDSVHMVANYEERFPAAFRLLRLGGVHPVELCPIHNPYIGQLNSDDFRNVGQHCVSVAFAAGVIAGELLSEGAISTTQRDEIILRALLHDLGKRFEVLRRMAGFSAYLIPGPELVTELSRLNVHPDLVAALADYGTEAGAETFSKFFSADKQGLLDLREGSLIIKVVRLADDMTATEIPQAGETARSAFLPFKSRVAACEFEHRNPTVFSSGWGVDIDGDLVKINDIASPPARVRLVGNMAALETMLAHELALQICKLLRLKTEEPELALQELIYAHLEEAH